MQNNRIAFTCPPLQYFLFAIYLVRVSKNSANYSGVGLLESAFGCTLAAQTGAGGIRTGKVNRPLSAAVSAGGVPVSAPYSGEYRAKTP
jgi:hypothetical protein